MQMKKKSIIISLLVMFATSATGQPLVSDYASGVLSKIKSDNLLDICERFLVGDQTTLQFVYETNNKTEILDRIKAGWSDFEQYSESVPGTDGSRISLKLNKKNVATIRVGDELTDNHLDHLDSMKMQGWDFSLSEIPETHMQITASHKKALRKDVIHTYTTFAGGLSKGHINFFEMRGMYGQTEIVQLKIVLGVKLTNNALFGRLQGLAKQTPTNVKVSEKDEVKVDPCEKPTKQFETEGFVRKQNKIKMTPTFRYKLLTDRFPEELKAVKLSANLVAEKIEGFKIDTLQRNSVLCLSGFQIGDVIKSMQGKILTDASQAIMLLQEIRNANRIVVEATRGGKKRSTTIEIK